MAEKITAGIDTSTDCCLVALGCEGKLWEESRQLSPRAHQKILLFELDRLLKKKGLSVEKLQLIVVGQGPGSYTGLRVGLATARALSQALKIPLYCLSTFKVIASSFFSQSDEVLVATDARRNQVYLALYRKKGSIEAIIPPSVFSREEAQSLVEKHLSSAFLVGDAFQTYPELSGGKRAEAKNWFPEGKWLLKLGWEGFLKKGETPLKEALPLYLRLSTAEERKLEKD